MARRRVGKIAVIIFLLLYLLPCSVLAAHTSDAKEPILTDKDCSLSVTYKYDTTVFSGQTLKLYKIADVTEDASYSLTNSFKSSNLVLNGIRTSGEWNVIRKTLETHIIANEVEPIHTGTTDNRGQVDYLGLEPGLYLVSSLRVAYQNSSCIFDSSLVALPGLESDGTWNYQTSINAKPEVLPTKSPEENIQYKVLKVWKDDKESRPQSIEIEIFKDETSVNKVILSEDNNWCYRWNTKDNGSQWTVVERNIPKGYTMTMVERGTTFVLTNTLIPDIPEKPTNTDNKENPSGVRDAFDILPATGDTANIMLAMMILLISGTILIISGFKGRKQEYEDNE